MKRLLIEHARPLYRQVEKVPIDDDLISERSRKGDARRNRYDAFTLGHDQSQTADHRGTEGVRGLYGGRDRGAHGLRSCDRGPALVFRAGMAEKRVAISAEDSEICAMPV
jgi:hypothetical protein